MGTGSGHIARFLGGSFRLVVGTDVDRAALGGRDRGCRNAVCCDGAEALSCSFDLIVCNMPYLDTRAVEDASTDGGRGGTEVPLRIMRSAVPRLAPGGRFLFVTSSLSDHKRLLGEARAAGLEARVARSRKLFFEELLVVEAVRPAG